MQEPSEGVTPADKNSLRLTKVKKTAAGIPAAISSLNHGIRKMGVSKTIKTLKDLIVPDVLGQIQIIGLRSSFVKMVLRQ